MTKQLKHHGANEKDGANVYESDKEIILYLKRGEAIDAFFLNLLARAKIPIEVIELFREKGEPILRKDGLLDGEILNADVTVTIDLEENEIKISGEPPVAVRA